MDILDFKKLLLKTAIIAISFDNEIHPDEIVELKDINNNTNYFKDIEFENEVENILEKLKNDSSEFLTSYFTDLRNLDLSITEILLLFEVLMRLVKADIAVNESEIKFIQTIRRIFSYVSNEFFVARFGEIEYLQLAKDETLEYKKEDLKLELNINDLLINKIQEGLK